MAKLPDKFTGELPLKEAYNDLLHPAATEVGKTVALPFRTVNVLLSPLFRWVANGESKLNDVSRLVSEEVKDVPPAALTDPQPYVAVPALQAITYSMDCDELKNMYAKLLAKAITVGEQEKVHPAYVEFIKQMSPLDAQLLKCLIDKNANDFPLCNMRFQKPSKPPFDSLPLFRNTTLGGTLYSHLALQYIPGVAEQDITIGIENLIRLGMIEILPNYSLEDSFYVGFDQLPIVQAYKQHLDAKRKEDSRELALIKLTGQITSLGQAFAAVCLSDSASNSK